MRFLATLALVCSTVALGIVAMATPGIAQDDVEPTTPPVVISEADEGDSPVGDIIPKPNSGREPTDAGDRGGALQLTLLALIVGFFAIAAFSIRRQMLAARGPSPQRRPPTEPGRGTQPEQTEPEQRV